MTITGLMKSYLPSNKLYRKCFRKSKTHPAHIRYAKYRNIYYKLIEIALTTYYANQFKTFKNASKNMDLIEKKPIYLAFIYISNITML